MNPLDKKIKIKNKNYKISDLIELSLNYPLSSVPTDALYRFIELNSFFIHKKSLDYIKFLKEKVMVTDLQFPVILTLNSDKFQILDGVNRISKAYFTKQSHVFCRIIPFEVL